jgi:hypothetical protein
MRISSLVEEIFKDDSYQRIQDVAMNSLKRHVKLLSPVKNAVCRALSLKGQDRTFKQGEHYARPRSEKQLFVGAYCIDNMKILSFPHRGMSKASSLAALLSCSSVLMHFRPSADGKIT